MEKRFDLSFSAPQTSREIAQLVLDEEFMRDVYTANDASDRRVLELDESGSRVRRVSRVELRRKLPAWIKAAIGETFGYFDHSRIDLSSNLMMLSIVPLEIHPRKIQERCGMEGKLALTDHRTETRVAFTGTIRSDLPLIGGKVAGFLHEELQNLARAIETTLQSRAHSYQPIKTSENRI